MITYILKTMEGEYYCGKTNNLERRMDEHKTTKYGWFSFKNRKEFIIMLIINGDYEKEIKRFGVEKYLKCLNNIENLITLVNKGLGVSLS